MRNELVYRSERIILELKALRANSDYFVHSVFAVPFSLPATPPKLSSARCEEIRHKAADLLCRRRPRRRSHRLHRHAFLQKLDP